MVPTAGESVGVKAGLLDVPEAVGTAGDVVSGDTGDSVPSTLGVGEATGEDVVEGDFVSEITGG